MKRITLLLALLISFLCFKANAQITSFPYTEDFESGDGGWTAQGGTWALGTPAAPIINTANSGANAWVTNLTGNYGNNEASSVVSPEYDFSALSAPAIQAAVWWNAEFSWDGMVFQSSIDNGATWQNVGTVGDPTNWFNDGTIAGGPGGQAAATAEGWTGRNFSNNGSGTWVLASHALDGLAGQSSVLLRFSFGSDGSVIDEGVAFDDVTVFEVTCPEPSVFVFDSATDTTANLSWTAGGAETAWEIVVQTAGTGIPTGAGTPTGSNAPYVAMGLTPATNYEAYIRTDCGGDVSIWVGPLNFATECTTFVAPYTEGFENGGTIPLCWTMDGGEDWLFNLTGPNHVGFEGTITGSTVTGNYYAVVDASGNDGPSTLTTPLVDVSTLTTPSITFYEISDNEGFANSTLEVEVWDGAAWNLMGTYNTNTSGWEQKTINISTLTITGDVQARFIFSETVTGDFYDDIAIDDVTFDELPSCVNPSNLAVDSTTSTTATLSWVSNGTETAWEVVVQAPGTGVPTGAGTAAPSNPYVAMGLTPATTYEYYIRADCGGGEYSDWIGPVIFDTECTTFVAPYTEGFENAGVIPLCWTMDGGEDWSFDDVAPAFGHIGDNGTITGNTATNGFFAWVDASGNDGPSTLTTPFVDVSTLTTPALSFYEISNNEGNANSTLDVEVWDGATWNNVGTYNINTSGWELKVIDISTLTITGDVQARFIFSETVTGDFYDDIAIDDVTFDELPSCVIPSGLNVTNITGTTADFSWMAGAGETSWEYVVQTAGTGVPTGAGTTSTTTTVNLNTLTFSTDYEAYVRADCGADGFSAWAGPLNFTTSVQLNFTVDCSVGPQNFVYCYENNDTNIFTFTSTDGTPLNFVINAGEVENNWDELVVFDTDGTTDLNAATPYGNAGQVGGISYQSTGDTISFTITSDGSVNCQGNGFTPLDITVFCATCINPMATYQVIDDCANGDQFLVDVNITSLGDATSLAIQDNQGNPAVSVSTTGITQFGPYPFLTDIVFTVSNEQDVNCVITSPTIQLLACPPDNDNCVNATVAQVNADETCTFITPGTIIEATPSGDPIGSCAGSPNDDVWFEFVALDEVEVISLLNIAGGTTNLDFALYEGSCGALIELQCYDATAGVSPLLTIGNTYYIRVFSGGNTSETSTFDLCIQKAPPGTICENAGSFCDNNGTQTAGNVIGFPSSGQIACLFSTPNPSWNIIQIGDPGLIEIQINQVNANGGGLDVDFVLWGPFSPDTDFCAMGLLDQDCGTQNCPNNTTNPNFYPSGNIIDCSYSAASTENLTINNAITGEIYVLLVTNFSNQPGDIQIQQTNSGQTGAGSTIAELEVEIESDEATFIDEDNDETTPSIANLCGISEATLCTNSPFADSFEWYINGIFQAGETGQCILATESNSYTVVAFDADCNVTAQDTKIINFYQEATANPVQDIITCDDESGDGIEDFDLESQTATILGTQSATEFVVTYYATLSDAQSGINVLTSPYNTSDGTTIYVRVEDIDAVGSGSGCASTNTTFNLVISGPLPVATSSDMELCDDDSRDGIEAFDLNSNDAAILNGQDPTVFSVSYYENETDAMNGMNALTSPYTNTSNPQTIYARVENTTATDCFKTTPFNLIVNDIPVSSFTTDFDYEVCPNATVPIIVTATPDNYTTSEVTIAWYNEGVLVSGQTDLSIDNVLTAGTYTIEVTFNDTGCLSSEDIVITELQTCVIPQGISPNGDGLNDTFDLSSYDVQSLQVFNRNGTLVYEKTSYLDQWHGQSLDGDELPVGTYYYVMNYQGSKTKAAWVYINR